MVFSGRGHLLAGVLTRLGSMPKPVGARYSPVRCNTLLGGSVPAECWIGVLRLIGAVCAVGCRSLGLPSGRWQNSSWNQQPRTAKNPRMRRRRIGPKITMSAHPRFRVSALSSEVRTRCVRGLAIGWPHFGHAAAWSETSLPQSGHFARATATSSCLPPNSLVTSDHYIALSRAGALDNQYGRIGRQWENFNECVGVGFDGSECPGALFQRAGGWISP